MAVSKDLNNRFFDGLESVVYNPDGVIAGDFNWGDVIAHEVCPPVGAPLFSSMDVSAFTSAPPFWLGDLDPLGLAFFPLLEPVCSEEPAVLTPLGNSAEELLHHYSREIARELRQERLLPLAGCDLFSNNWLYVKPDLLGREIVWDFLGKAN